MREKRLFLGKISLYDNKLLWNLEGKDFQVF